jgi:hypothetical protein
MNSFNYMIGLIFISTVSTLFDFKMSQNINEILKKQKGIFSN